jgi:hypothetical protein
MPHAELKTVTLRVDRRRTVPHWQADSEAPSPSQALVLPVLCAGHSAAGPAAAASGRRARSGATDSQPEPH